MLEYDLNPNAKFIDGFGFCTISIVSHFDTEDIDQINEIKENSKIHELIGLPNNSAIFIKDNVIEFINECYLYDNR